MHSPLDARRQGIETVYQDLALAPDLTVAENLFLGRELKRAGPLRLDRPSRPAEMNGRRRPSSTGSRSASARSPTGPTSLSGGQRQAIAVARAVAWGRRVILMDEPTAALGVEEQQRVADLIGEVRQNGIPVLLVSHNIPQVHEVCDRVVVLLHGRVVANLDTKRRIEEVVMWITGAALTTRNRNEGERRASPSRERRPALLAALKVPRSGRVTTSRSRGSRNATVGGASLFEVMTYRTPRRSPGARGQEWLLPRTTNGTSASSATSSLGSSHSGTHMDALSHITVGEDSHWHGGFTEAEHLGDWGPLVHDACGARAACRRGVVIDVAGLTGEDRLPSGYGVSDVELRRSAEEQGLDPARRRSPRAHGADVRLARQGTA